MGATPPPHPCGRTESCTLRILTDAFAGAHRMDKESEDSVGAASPPHPCAGAPHPCTREAPFIVATAHRGSGALYPVLVLRTRLRWARGVRGVSPVVWRLSGARVVERRGTGRTSRGAVGLWECGLSRAMPSRSEGRRTFVGLTVHGRMEGGLESRLQSSPAEGLTVTEAEAGLRGGMDGKEGRARGGLARGAGVLCGCVRFY